jgi:protease PrsW
MDNPESQESDKLQKDYGSAFGMEDAGKIGLSKILDEFKSLNYSDLIPLNKIFNSGILRKKAVRWVMFFGLLPLIYAWFVDEFQLNFIQAVWLIEIYFCLFWALYFFSIIQPSKTIWKQGIGYALFTAAIGIPVLLSLQTLPVIKNLYSETTSRNLFGRLTGFVLGVGILEETCKALPLIIFGLRKKTIRGIQEGMFLGFLSGLGFAASEGVTYTVRATANAIYYGDATWQMMTFLDRVMSGPLQHGAWAGVVGWFIGVAAKREGKKYPVVVVGILFMAIMHGCFDVFSDGLIGILIAALGYLIFMAYLIHENKAGGSVKISAE